MKRGEMELKCRGREREGVDDKKRCDGEKGARVVVTMRDMS